MHSITGGWNPVCLRKKKIDKSEKMVQKASNTESALKYMMVFPRSVPKDNRRTKRMMDM